MRGVGVGVGTDGCGGVGRGTATAAAAPEPLVDVDEAATVTRAARDVGARDGMWDEGWRVGLFPLALWEGKQKFNTVSCPRQLRCALLTLAFPWRAEERKNPSKFSHPSRPWPHAHAQRALSPLFH